MKFRLGACAAVVLLAACSGQESGSEMAALKGSAGGDNASMLAQASLPAARPQPSIASAPDRGALMSFENGGKPARREGAYTYYPVAMSEDHALKAVVTGEMVVPMPDGSQAKLRYERHEENIDGNWTWIGRLEGGDPAQEAVITFGPDAVFGSIPRPNARPLSIQTGDGGLWAVDADPSKLVSGNKGHDDIMVAAAEVRGAALAQSAVAQSAVAQSAVAQGAPANASNTIDVAIGYTAGFRTRAGGSASAASSRLVNLIAYGNQAFSNSKVNGTLRLVRALEVSYTETNTNQQALHELTGSNGNSNVAIPSGLVPLREARDEYGADVAVLMRGFQQPEHQGCGVAWLNGAGQSAIDPAADARWGYAVVSDGSDSDTGGQSYFCADESLVHEIGHVLGSAHDAANSKNDDGSQLYGRYAYSFGYKAAANAGNFFTVMAYGDENQVPYRVFSHPGTTFCGGRACGVANQADNARSLNQTIPVVAQFRSTVVPFKTGIPRDVNGDGRTDLLWRYPGNITSNVRLWTMNGTTRLNEITATLSAAYKVVATGDFNGDGRMDIVWRNDSTNQLVMWIGSGTKFTSHTLPTYNQRWSVVGAGDVDGDGKSDLLWRYDSDISSNFRWWMMNGATRTAERTATLPVAYKFATAADFNGDGLLDIVWRNTSTNALIMWVGNGQSFAQHSLPTYNQRWRIVGAGDVDGDGRSDLLWHYDATLTGNFRYWMMNGPTRVKERSATLDAAYQLATLGDFNGNRYLDIVWRKPSGTDPLVLWSGNGTSFTSAKLATYNNSWQIMNK